jgi:hypothetical protein
MSSHIPTFYTILFLYVDPLINLSGIYLEFFDQNNYLENGVPSLLTSNVSQTDAIYPLVQYLILALGSFSVCILAFQVLLVHGFKNAANGLNVTIWKIVMFGILLSDLGLLYAIYIADSETFLNLSMWGSGDWTTNGILGSLVIFRTAFLLGVGGVGK